MIGSLKFVMRPATYLIDTRAGTNLINDAYLRPQWRRQILELLMPKLRKATNQSIYAVIIILLIVQVRDSPGRNWFNVVKYLAVVVLRNKFYQMPNLPHVTLTEKNYALYFTIRRNIVFKKWSQGRCRSIMRNSDERGGRQNCCHLSSKKGRGGKRVLSSGYNIHKWPDDELWT